MADCQVFMGTRPGVESAEYQAHDEPSLCKGFTCVTSGKPHDKPRREASLIPIIQGMI